MTISGWALIIILYADVGVIENSSKSQAIPVRLFDSEFDILQQKMPDIPGGIVWGRITIVQNALSGIVIIVGNYGSGKTEVAVNLAIHQQQMGISVRIADLDLVNPYFRTREARNTLTAMGIDVIVPPEHLLQADLPILVPQVAGALKAPGELTIIDVGGDDVGATVLSSLANFFQDNPQPKLLLQVVNPFRPNTASVKGCLKMCRAIESRARLSVDKWVGNAHLLDETTIEHVYQGDTFMTSLSEAGDPSVEFITAPYQLLDQLDFARLGWPVLPIHRQLVPPWKKADRLPV